MKYNWKVVLQYKKPHHKNVRSNVVAETITDVINRCKTFSGYSIKSITRTPHHESN